MAGMTVLHRMRESQGAAVLSAQWRSLWNSRAKPGARRFSLPFVLALLWYGIWTATAIFAALVIKNAENWPAIRNGLGGVLLGITLYWQLVPVLAAGSGVSLQLRRLMVYPIPPDQLWIIQVVVRISAAVEMVILSAGLAAGLVLQPAAPPWSILAMLAFCLFNTLLSAGTQELLSRIFERRWIRELAIFLVVMVAALPRWLGEFANRAELLTWFAPAWHGLWPWTAAVNSMASGREAGLALLLLTAWTAAAGLFSRWQFWRTLQFDAEAARSGSFQQASSKKGVPLLGRLLSGLPDPLAALIEKEVSFLRRSPRFRLVFLMGFSFGLVIWLPMMGSISESAENFWAANYLSAVCVYAMMLLGEALYWNSFGMDRGAVSFYWAAPLKLRDVLLAKNASAFLFTAAEIFAVTLICGLLRMPLTPLKIGEAWSTCLVLFVFFAAAGNWLSVRYPRPVNPAKSWGTAGRSSAQLYLLLLYPLASAPVALAFLARFAFDTEWAFYAVIALDLALAALIYTLVLQSSEAELTRTRDEFVTLLASGDDPIV